MAIRRTASGGYRASNGRVYKNRKSAVRATRAGTVSRASNGSRKRKDKRRMRGRRR